MFNAAEAFHSGRLEGCSSLSEAEVEALGQFSHEVQLLQRVAGDGSTPALGGTAPPCLSHSHRLTQFVFRETFSFSLADSTRGCVPSDLHAPISVSGVRPEVVYKACCFGSLTALR